MFRPSQAVLDVVGTLVRLGLAAVWLVSGSIKISDPGQTYLAVKAYQVFPDGLVHPVATALPLLELALGVFLLIGLFTRVAATVAAVLLLLFIAGVAQSWARGLTIDCGCFGGGGQVADGQTQYPQEIARDVGFLILAGWLIVRSRTRIALDGWLRAGQAQVHADAEHQSEAERI
ncbi:DoxX family membrane protein [Amycolatopsis acidicola]|uniref:DoxX family membrane protein n=1 Tax=Amycolatopsis acidicola TaxID=2596893 RepID=A0A5N0VJZ9_9PSEU|nr:MauE/DoxX family redox-associated membrane protein [Amycolatopsis acidicola]KAA9165490.1 DoxX family membrane protein [Amycolatopsis acidicola]